VTTATVGSQPLSSLNRRPDVLLAFVAGTVGIAVVYYVLLLQETNFHRVIAADASRPVYGVVVAALAIAACLLFGANFATFNVLARVRWGGRLSAATGVGGLAGAFGAGCPTCGAFLLSAVGVNGGLAVLPLAGIELWAGACLLMGVTLWSTIRRLESCQGPDCPILPTPSRLHMAMLGTVALLATIALISLIAVNN
jgi:hypothetical protein